MPHSFVLIVADLPWQRVEPCYGDFEFPWLADGPAWVQVSYLLTCFNLSRPIPRTWLEDKLPIDGWSFWEFLRVLRVLRVFICRFISMFSKSFDSLGLLCMVSSSSTRGLPLPTRKQTETGIQRFTAVTLTQQIQLWDHSSSQRRTRTPFVYWRVN